MLVLSRCVSASKVYVNGPTVLTLFPCVFVPVKKVRVQGSSSTLGSAAFSAFESFPFSIAVGNLVQSATFFHY